MAKIQLTTEVIKTFEDTFHRLPPLPPQSQKMLVRILPWLCIVTGVIGVVWSFVAISIATTLRSFFFVQGETAAPANIMTGAVLWFVSSILLLVAFFPIQKKKQIGWILLFWSVLISVIASITYMSYLGVLTALMSLYLLFQIKQYYK